jgi:hypothetical protein
VHYLSVQISVPLNCQDISRKQRPKKTVTLMEGRDMELSRRIIVVSADVRTKGHKRHYSDCARIFTDFRAVDTEKLGQKIKSVPLCSVCTGPLHFTSSDFGFILLCSNLHKIFKVSSFLKISYRNFIFHYSITHD